MTLPTHNAGGVKFARTPEVASCQVVELHTEMDTPAAEWEWRQCGKPAFGKVVGWDDGYEARACLWHLVEVAKDGRVPVVPLDAPAFDPLRPKG